MRFLDRVEGVGSADGVALLARQWAVEAIARGLPDGSALGRLDPTALDELAVAAAAEAGDPAALAIVDRLADRLARICLVLGDLLDVDRIIVGGGAATALPMVVEGASRLVERSGDPTAPDVLASTLGPGTVATGAIEHALGRVRERALDILPPARVVA
jgi:predicted NBD/HSP70 family sugar kinase